jgi:hypothetical protein
MRSSRGRTSRNSSIRLPLSSTDVTVTPVMLRPGRASVSAMPASTGSALKT